MKYIILFVVIIFFGGPLVAQVGYIDGKNNERISVPWSVIEEQTTLELEIGRFLYEEEGEKRETVQSYLIAWTFHYNEREFQPMILKWYPGHSHELRFKDLNDDGKEELIVFYIWGAHTHIWEVFSPGNDFEYGGSPLDSLGEIGSDWGCIELLQEKENGYFQIRVLKRHWEDQEYVDVATYSYIDGQYRQTSNKTVHSTSLLRRE